MACLLVGPDPRDLEEWGNVEQRVVLYIPVYVLFRIVVFLCVSTASSRQILNTEASKIVNKGPTINFPGKSL